MEPNVDYLSQHTNENVYIEMEEVSDKTTKKVKTVAQRVERKNETAPLLRAQIDQREIGKISDLHTCRCVVFTAVSIFVIVIVASIVKEHH